MTRLLIKQLIISIACLLVLIYNGFAQEKADSNKTSAKEFNEAMMTGSPHEDEFYITKAREYIEKHKDIYQITNLQQELRLNRVFRWPPPAPIWIYPSNR